MGIPWDSRAISAKRGSLYACFDKPGASDSTLEIHSQRLCTTLEMCQWL